MGAMLSKYREIRPPDDGIISFAEIAGRLPLLLGGSVDQANQKAVTQTTVELGQFGNHGTGFAIFSH